MPILKDPRYIKVHGNPVLMVYRVSLLPDPCATAEIWRAECRKAGLSSVHLVALQSVGVHDPHPFGFDATVEFPPVVSRATNHTQSYFGPSPRKRGYFTDRLS